MSPREGREALILVLQIIGMFALIFAIFAAGALFNA